MAADVFVSYARKDRDQVLPWVQRLQHAGVSLWLDETDIDGAHLWTGEITEAIDACRLLLLILSPAAVASRQVAREVALASGVNKPILPLLLEPTPITGSFRYHLADVQHIELFGADLEQKLPSILRALARLGVAPPGQEAAAPSAPTSSAALRASSRSAAISHNLPQPLTRFIGREREIAALKEQLAGARLLTLTGAGGTGKTRLALQVAGELPDAYPDGVWLVELEALADPSLVPQEVARALAVREEPGRPLIETLLGALRPKALLLVLDNCEHLIDACAELTHALLRACPGVRLLATSRQPLGVPGESLFRVPSLSAPAPPPPPMEQLTQYEAVRLFIDRAQLSQPSFAVTNANAPAVAEVCYRLDGIPLAIELAASRVKLLSPEQILTRLEDRFRLLTGGSRAVLARHQTLQAAFDWSYDVLTEGEQALLRRLSVFAGGFSLEAAEAVCSGVQALRRSGAPVEKPSPEHLSARSPEHPNTEILDLLGQLVDKSLVQVDELGSESRYRLVETIRQYAAAKLRDAGETGAGWGPRTVPAGTEGASWGPGPGRFGAEGDSAGGRAPGALRERHRDWYLALAEEAEPELTGPRQGEWLGRLEVEHENLRAALAWCTQQSQPEAGLRLGGALSRFWDVRGYWAEGRESLAEVLAVPGAETQTAERGRALNGAGNLARVQGDYSAARAHFEESLVIRRHLGDQQGIAGCLGNLGIVAWEQADYRAARALLEECLAICRHLGDQWGIAVALIWLGNVASSQGEYEAARGLHEESLAICRQLGDQGCIAYSLNNLAEVARFQGDDEAARGLHEESLTIRRQLGDQHGIACSLEGLAAVAVAQGQPEHAARLFGAAEALREAIGSPLSPGARADYDRAVAAVRAALDEAAFAAWAEGRALSLEQAIALALGETRTG